MESTLDICQTMVHEPSNQEAFLWQNLLRLNSRENFTMWQAGAMSAKRSYQQKRITTNSKATSRKPRKNTATIFTAKFWLKDNVYKSDWVFYGEALKRRYEAEEMSKVILEHFGISVNELVTRKGDRRVLLINLLKNHTAIYSGFWKKIIHMNRDMNRDGVNFSFFGYDGEVLYQRSARRIRMWRAVSFLWFTPKWFVNPLFHKKYLAFLKTFSNSRGKLACRCALSTAFAGCETRSVLDNFMPNRYVYTAYST